MNPLPAFRKTEAGLVPANEAGRAQLAKVKDGQVCVCDIRRPRNPAHHRKLFALMNLLVDNTEIFATVDEALYALKAAMGAGKWVQIPGTSRPFFLPDSINFESMAQAEFEFFYTKAIATIIKHWLPTESAEIQAAVEAFQD